MRRFSSLRALALACGVLALGLAGCESSTEPAESLTVTLDFGVGRPTFMPPFSTARTGNQLLLRGTIETVCAPFTPSATVARTGDLLVLTVELAAAADCSPTQASANYDATITGYNRLTNFRVIHRWPNSDREDAIVYESVWD